MDTKREKLIKILLLLLLALFPFGQLLRSEISLFGSSLTLHPIDVASGLILLALISGRFKKPKLFPGFIGIVLILVFSSLFSLTIFDPAEVFRGIFYLLRLLAYLSLPVAIFNVAKKKTEKNLLISLLLIISVVAAIFGWIQYFWIPDLRDLYFVGWDDHLYRLIGTFLDPGFTGIILVFGFLISLIKYLKNRRKFFLALSLFFLVTVAFTYARASYVALLAGVYVISKVTKNYKSLVLSFTTLLVLISFLPRPEGYGVMLERTHSIYAKLGNYSETMEIIKKSPVFGIGFNNFCEARVKFLGEVNKQSHSCSGSDSSLLLTLATTGIVGLFIFSKAFLGALASIRKGEYKVYSYSILAAVLVHSLFLNSLFYPWVMGYMGIIVGISLKD